MKHAALLLFALILSLVAPTQAEETPKHFDPQGKPPSKFTLELRDGVKAELPFADKRDFEEAKKGFIAAPPFRHHSGWRTRRRRRRTAPARHGRSRSCTGGARR